MTKTNILIKKVLFDYSNKYIIKVFDNNCRSHEYKMFNFKFKLVFLDWPELIGLF